MLAPGVLSNDTDPESSPLTAAVVAGPSNGSLTLNPDGTLFTDDEWAWPETPEEDAGIVEAFRRGSEAVLTGRSERGTVTRDTFSLLGFTSSLEEAQRLCAR